MIKNKVLHKKMYFKNIFENKKITKLEIFYVS